ncbi:MAG: HvfC/BufC N-terminal domain-containing protein [Marinibacterium sp.]
MTVGQDRFRTALLDPAAAIPASLRDHDNRPAGKRFDVYRNNVAVSLTQALHEAFPVVARLIGKDAMDTLAGLFLRAHPPSSPLMMQYGAALPDFIAGLPQLADLGYLPDVARLELALRRSYHAADAAPVDAGALAALAPDAMMRARLGLAPAVQMLQSPWPVLAIWRFNTEPDAPKPLAGAQDVLITRPDFDPMPRDLPPGAAGFVTALAHGATIGGAYQTACASIPEFDPGPCLAQLLAGKAITSIIVKE